MSEEILELSYNRPYTKPYKGMKVTWLDATGKMRFAHITKITGDKTWVIWDGSTSQQPYSKKDFEGYLRDGTFKRE